MKKYIITFVSFVLFYPFWMNGFYFYIIGEIRDKLLFDFIGGVFCGIIFCLFLRFQEYRHLKNRKNK